MENIKSSDQAFEEWVKPHKEELKLMAKSNPDFDLFMERLRSWIDEYQDLGPGGDWSLLKEIIFTEIFLNKQRNHPALSIEEYKDIASIQKSLDTMIKTLGTNRKDRRKEIIESTKIIIDASKLQQARENALVDRELLFSFQEEAAKFNKGVTEGGMDFVRKQLQESTKRSIEGDVEGQTEDGVEEG